MGGILAETLAHEPRSRINLRRILWYTDRSLIWSTEIIRVLTAIFACDYQWSKGIRNLAVVTDVDLDESAIGPSLMSSI